MGSNLWCILKGEVLVGLLILVGPTRHAWRHRKCRQRLAVVDGAPVLGGPHHFRVPFFLLIKILANFTRISCYSSKLFITENNFISDSKSELDIPFN